MCFRATRCSLARSLAECFDSGVHVWLSSTTGRVERCVEPSQSFPACTNGIFPLGEQLSLLPRQPDSCESQDDPLHINCADSAGSGQMFDSFCPSFVSFIEFGACRMPESEKKKKYTHTQTWAGAKAALLCVVYSRPVEMKPSAPLHFYPRCRAAHGRF